MTDKLFIDIETYSSVHIDRGVYRYVAAPDVLITLGAWWLGDEREIDPALMNNAPVSESVLKQMIETETQLRDRRTSEFEAQRAYYVNAVKQGGEQIACSLRTTR